MEKQSLSKTVLERVPLYLHYLKGHNLKGTNTISSAAIAKGVKLGEVQVRKDLALISGAGKPKIGYRRDELIEHLTAVVNSEGVVNVVIIGAGKIGKALLDYEGFSEYGMNIVAAFDSDPSKISPAADKTVQHIAELPYFCKDYGVKIGIIAVPESQAQTACDALVENGIKAIWNFAPINPDVPDGVIVKNENLAASLAVLSAKLKKQ